MKTIIPGIAVLLIALAASPVVAADFNGDGTNDIGIFRQSSGLWAVRSVTRVYFGASGDDPVPGDYDGDGTVDIGLFRASSGLWAARGVTRVYFGSSGDEPLAGIPSGTGSGVVNLWQQNGNNIYYTTGNVGIGTSAPVYPLHLKKSHHGGWLMGIHNTGYALNDYGLVVRADAGDPLWIQTSGGNSALRVEQDGDVGIGMNNPAYELDVYGDIRATGSVYYGGTINTHDGTPYIKPDFVFKEDYRALTIAETEEFIRREGRLPWITAAADEKDGAINMTRMSFEAIEATENLQLQVIALHKLVTSQQSKIETQNKQIHLLEEKVVKEQTREIESLQKELRRLKKDQ